MAKKKSTKKSSKKKKMAAAKPAFRTILNPKEGSLSFIAVKGTKLKVGKNVKIKDKASGFMWEGKVQKSFDSETVGTACVECKKGATFGKKLKKDLDPGDLVDVDVTVDTSTETQEVVLYP